MNLNNNLFENTLNKINNNVKLEPIPNLRPYARHNRNYSLNDNT